MSRRQSQYLKVAAATIHPDLEPSVTRERICEVIESTLAADPDVRLILFGEVILGWFGRKGKTREYHGAIAEAIDGPSIRFISEAAKKHGVYVSFGLSERDGETIYNTQVLLSPEGELIAAHRKFWVFNPAFTAGERTLTAVDIDGAKVALLICADVRSTRLLRAIRKEKVDVVLAGLADYGTDFTMSKIIGTLFDAWAMTANRIGVEDAIEWHGLTTITDRWGRLVQSSIGRECVLVQSIPLGGGSSWARVARRMVTPFRTGALILAMVLGKLWPRNAGHSSRSASSP